MKYNKRLFLEQKGILDTKPQKTSKELVDQLMWDVNFKKEYAPILKKNLSHPIETQKQIEARVWDEGYRE